MITFLRAHKRAMVITFSWVAYCVFWLIPKRREGPEPCYFLFFSAGFVLLIAG